MRNILRHEIYHKLCSAAYSCTFCSTLYQPCFAVQHAHASHQTYLTTVHGNSWDCPIPSLSQLLPDTLPDLITDTKSALLRDSLWWEAGKKDGSNRDQAEHGHFDSCWLAPHTRLLACTSVHFIVLQPEPLTDSLTDRAEVGFIPSLIHAVSLP